MAGKKGAAARQVRIVFPPKVDGHLKEIGGSSSDAWNNILANQVISSLWLAHSDDTMRNDQGNAAIGALVGIRPKDEIEGIIAAQLMATHHAAMDCYRRAMLENQSFEGRQAALAQANKLCRTSAILVDALNRHRGKGQQKVTVEHVHVHGGGQAIVGNVAAPVPGGRGVATKSEEQSHAIPYSPGQTMPRADAEREVVPVASDAERPVQDARWNQSGGAEGKPERP